MTVWHKILYWLKYKIDEQVHCHPQTGKCYTMSSCYMYLCFVFRISVVIYSRKLPTPWCIMQTQITTLSLFYQFRGENTVEQPRFIISSPCIRKSLFNSNLSLVKIDLFHSFHKVRCFMIGNSDPYFLFSF